MSRALASVGSLQVLTLIVAACGSDRAPPSYPRGAGADPETYAQAICGYLSRCNQQNIARLYGDVGACVTTQRALIARAFTARGNTLTQAQLEACTTKLGVPSCDAFLDQPECDFRGALPDGEACLYHSQCSSGTCFQVGASSCGKCAARTPAGGDCTAADCAFGLYCSTTSKCVEPIRTEGAACNDEDLLCGSSLFCVGGKCTRPLRENAACDDGQPGPPCDLDLVCLPTIDGSSAGTCQAVTLASIGERCGFDPEKHLLVDCRLSSCSAAIGGTCTAFLAAGTACTLGGISCAVGLECIDGVCADPDVEGCKE